MTRTNFDEVCPFIIWNSIYKTNDHKTTHQKISTNVQELKQKKFMYVSILLAIVSFVVTIFLLFFKERKISPNKGHCYTQFFVSFSIGTLSGDAIMHVLPKVINPEMHHIGNHALIRKDILKMIGVIGGIYFCYLIESLARLYTQLCCVRSCVITS